MKQRGTPLDEASSGGSSCEGDFDLSRVAFTPENASASRQIRADKVKLIGGTVLWSFASAQVKTHVGKSGQRCQIGKARTPSPQRSSSSYGSFTKGGK